MGEFNLERANAGEPVCTRDGRDVEISGFNRGNVPYPVCGVIFLGKNKEDRFRSVWNNEGKFSVFADFDMNLDLMMVD